MSDWLKHVFDHPDGLGCLIICGKTILVYLFLIGGLRLIGKRELGQMNLFDLVLIVVLGNAVQNAMMNNDNTLAGGLIAAATLLATNQIFSRVMRRSRRFERAMAGNPVLILNNGIPIKAHMEKEGISREQLMQALREHGICSLEEAKMCVLEVDGSISVVPEAAEVLKTRRHFKALRIP